MLTHFLFDFDGTLIDSSPSILASFATALARLEITPVVALDQSLIGPPLRTTLRRLTGIEDADRIESVVDAFKQDYDTDGYRQTLAYPGIDEALRALHAGGNRLWIVTNKRIVPTRKILAHLGWDRLFEGVFALDSFSPSEPNKRVLVARVLHENGISVTAAMMVGDTLEDAEAARENGIEFRGAAWGYGALDARNTDGNLQLLSQASQLKTLVKPH